MRELNVFMPCGKTLKFYIREGKAAHCTNPRVLAAWSGRGIIHFNGIRYFPGDGERFLEALHDFYWLKGLSVKTD